MTEVIDRLAAAVNAHDLDAVAGLIHEDYRSEQPAHPGRAFAGRAQMLANWEAMLAGIPDFCAEICRSVQDGDTTWTEWRWSGTRSDGQAFEMRGVTLFEVMAVRLPVGGCTWRTSSGTSQYRAGRGGPVRPAAAARAPVGRRSARSASWRSSRRTSTREIAFTSRPWEG